MSFRPLLIVVNFLFTKILILKDKLQVSVWGGKVITHDGRILTFVINPQTGDLEGCDLIRNLTETLLIQMRKETGWKPERHGLWENFHSEFINRPA